MIGCITTHYCGIPSKKVKPESNQRQQQTTKDILLNNSPVVFKNTYVMKDKKQLSVTGKKIMSCEN